MTTQQHQGDAVPEWTVGDRLRKAREVLGLDQVAFAALTGISRGTISNYERGLTNTYKTLFMRAWAMATGVSLEWLETGVAGPQPEPPPRAKKSTSELERLTRAKMSRTRHTGTTTHQ